VHRDAAAASGQTPSRAPPPPPPAPTRRRAAPAGELQEPSKKAITRLVEAQDLLVENAKNGTDGEAQQR
jgi:hypothetical protein